MMAGMSVAEVRVVTRNDDLLDGNLIRRWLAWGFVWLLVFPTVGAVVAAKFNHPDFLGGVAWLSFGRLRPIHVNGVIWARSPRSSSGWPITWSRVSVASGWRGSVSVRG